MDESAQVAGAGGPPGDAHAGAAPAPEVGDENGANAPSGDLDDEVRRLRAANAALTARVEGNRRRRGGRVRRAAVGVMLGLSCVLLTLSSVVVWAHRTVLTTDGFVATVSPVLRDPAVTAALGTELSDQFFQAVDLQNRIEARLPDRAAPLAAPIANAAEGFIRDKVIALLRTPQAQALFEEVLRYGHAQVVAALRNESDVLTVSGGSVVLNMLPLLNDGLRQVEATASGLLGRDVTLPTITSGEIPADARAKLSKALGVSLPSDFGQVTLLKASKVASAQAIVKGMDLLRWLLPVLTVLLIAGALWLSLARRRSLMQLSVATFVVFVLVRRLTFRLETDLVASAKPANRPAASAIIHQLLGGFLEVTVWVLALAAVVFAVAAVTGPYAWARSLRRGIGSGLRASWHALSGVASAVVGGERGRRTAEWVAGHSGWLQIGGAAVGAVLLFLLPWVGILVVLLVLVAYELIVWRIAAVSARRREDEEAAGGAASPGARRPGDGLKRAG